MNKDEIIDAYNYLNNAFSNYMVGDMNTPRDDYDVTRSIQFICEDAYQDGVILAKKLLKYNKGNKSSIRHVVKILNDHSESSDDEFIIEGNEGDRYKSKNLIKSLIFCYQLDNHHPDVVNSYINGFMSVLGE